MRHQRVLEVERRPASRHDVVDPLLKAHGAASVQVGARAGLRAGADRLLVAAAAEVASSLTFIRWVLANSAKMLFGWSEEIGCLSFAGRSPSMIAGCARSVES